LPHPSLSNIVMRRETDVDATAAGERFLVTVPAGSDQTGGTAPNTRLNVVLNWFEELNRLVPTGGS
jgi:poly(3-hydroxybutyrate) depolymerase